MGVEAEGLPDAAQGDVKGAEIKGGIEEAVQAGIQEFQFFQEGGLAGGVLLALLQSRWRARCLVWRQRAEGLRPNCPARER